MAMLWVDGFDDLATSSGANVATPLARRYALSGSSAPNWKSGTGRLGGYTLNSDSGTAYVTLQNLGTTNDTLIVGIAIYTKNELSSNTTVLALYDNDVSGINVRWNTKSGSIRVYRGSTYLGESATGVVAYAGWYYMELKTKCHSTAGTVEVRIGDEPVVSLSGINTQAGDHPYHTGLWLYPSSVVYDDMYVFDASGSVNNDFFGNCRVATIFPNGDGGTNQWTCSTGSDHYALVDEGAENDDTDYLSSSTPGQVDLWDYGDTSGLLTVGGAMITTVIRDTEMPASQLKTLIKSGSTTSEDTAQTIGFNNYAVRRRITEIDPDTSSAWTESSINAAQFGIKVA